MLKTIACFAGKSRHWDLIRVPPFRDGARVDGRGRKTSKVKRRKKKNANRNAPGWTKSTMLLTRAKPLLELTRNVTPGCKVYHELITTTSNYPAIIQRDTAVTSLRFPSRPALCRNTNTHRLPPPTTGETKTSIYTRTQIHTPWLYREDTPSAQKRRHAPHSTVPRCVFIVIIILATGHQPAVPQSLGGEETQQQQP